MTYGSNAAFLGEWLAGTMPTDITYGPDMIGTDEMAASPGAAALRDEFYRRGCQNVSGFSYGTVQAYWQTLINPFTADWGSTAAQVGGFGGASAITSGNGKVTFVIPNVAGTHSFFLHAVPDRKGATGSMHNVNQTFIWSEKIDECRCKAKK